MKSFDKPTSMHSIGMPVVSRYQDIFLAKNLARNLSEDKEVKTLNLKLQILAVLPFI